MFIGDTPVEPKQVTLMKTILSHPHHSGPIVNIYNYFEAIPYKCVYGKRTCHQFSSNNSRGRERFGYFATHEIQWTVQKTYETVLAVDMETHSISAIKAFVGRLTSRCRDLFSLSSWLTPEEKTVRVGKDRSRPTSKTAARAPPPILLFGQITSKARWSKTKAVK